MSPRPFHGDTRAASASRHSSDAAIAEHGPDARAGAGHHLAARDASQVVGNAVMHAAMSWVACCMETPAERVEVAQVAPGAFQATVIFADDKRSAVPLSRSEAGGHFMLSVALLLETGPRLTWQVEPIHP